MNKLVGKKKGELTFYKVNPACLLFESGFFKFAWR